MTTIFIDGESGTTGLRLRERIANRADLKLISLPADGDEGVRRDGALPA